jgi:hypothetical protein
MKSKRGSFLEKMNPAWRCVFVALTVLLMPACRAESPLEHPEWPVKIQPKRVFAHYMVCCPTAGSNAGVKDFEREILAAQSRGIDGFALNCGGWTREGQYKKRVVDFYQAARNLDSGFVLFISADFCCGLTLDEVEDMMRTFYNPPNQFKYDGKPVLSTFITGPELKTVADKMAKSGKPIVTVPYTFPQPASEHPRGEQIDQVFDRFNWVDGFFFFAGAGTGEQNAESNELLARKWLGAGKIYMAGITPYYRGLGGNYRLFDTNGFEGMVKQWKTIIEMDIPWVEFVTWNDWGESSYIAPFGKPADTQLWNGDWGLLPSHVAYLDASRHYIDWFKSGKEPAITRDRVFYFYRPHPKALDGVVKIGESRRDKPDHARSLHDSIYATAFLTAPAKLTITCGGANKTFDLPAGVSNVELPFEPGRPHFKLERDGQAVLEKDGEHEISATDSWANFNYFGGEADGPASAPAEKSEK